MSAIVLALGLTGAGATPFIMQSASASVMNLDPVEPCDAGEACETVPETTVTTTVTLGEPTPETTESAPETTVTKTVTASPPQKTTKAPKPTKTATANPTPPPSTPTQNPQPLPTQPVEVPSTQPTTPTQEQSVEMPTVAPEETVNTTPPPLPTETQVASDEEVPLELRNAAPEFDQSELANKLSIPALVLVLLALFAVLIFEGRLRRMAHAAAVRKAGPQLSGPEMPPPPGGGYPAGPGYAAAGFPAPGYPGGTAYAPIISFVPVQTYPSGPPQYGYQDPNHPYPPQNYVEEQYAPQPPPPEPVVLHPDEFDSYNEPPATGARERDPFEPVIPPEPPSTDIPPGGANPYDGDVEQPLGPASAAEAGDSEPWQHRPGSLFEPASREPASSREPGSLFEPRGEDAISYEPPPYLPADEDVTAVQPLPPQPEPAEQESGGPEPTKEMPDSKRRRFGRKKK